MNQIARMLTWIGVCFFFSGSALLTAQIPYAHAHNDYEHERPLLDALEHEFISVEADVHLIEGELYVYHDYPEAPEARRTLENLYLRPLKERITANGGSVYPGYAGRFFLMVDIKSEGEPTYAVLRKQLKKYRSMLSAYKGQQLLRKGAVTLFLSGNRPVEAVRKRKKRWVAIDGRPSDLGKGIPASLMPVVSDHYLKHLSWDGTGEVPVQDKRTLANLSRRVQEEGKMLRLWASPENTGVWAFLLSHGAGLINTDQLAELQVFAKTNTQNGE